MKRKIHSILLIIIYLFAIILANWSITHFGPTAAVYNAFIFIGLDLITRDRIHDIWRGKYLFTKMAALIFAGSFLSWYLVDASEKIAIASCIAFASAAIADTIVYQILIKTEWFERSNISNIFAAGADSIVFQTIAFGWNFPFIFAQFTAKISGGLLYSIAIKRIKIVNENISS